MQAKDWCFTINNPRRKHGNVDSDWDRVKSWVFNYLVMQLEVGEGNSTYPRICAVPRPKQAHEAQEIVQESPLGTAKRFRVPSSPLL